MTSTSSLLTIIFSILALILCITRIYSGVYLASRYAGRDGVKSARMLPYWVPFLGHILTLAKDPEKLIHKVRDQSRQGLFSLNLFGHTHHFIYGPSLIKEIHQQRSSTVDYASVVWYILHRIFGAKSKDRKLYRDAHKDFMEILGNHLLRRPQLTKMLSVTIGNMEENIANLVSFASSPVDQSPWERVSNTSLVDRSSNTTEQVVETNLCSLIRDFTGHMSTASLMGRAFLDNYPDTLQDLWRLDNGFKYLALGLPRWLPIHSLTEAHLARHRLTQAVIEFHYAMDGMAVGVAPGAEWGELEDVGEIMKRRNKVWRDKYGASPQSRAAGDLSLIWAMNVNANHLCFWLLLRILSNPALLSLIREEVAPYITLTQPPSPNPHVPCSPQVQISTESLSTSCPYLKAAYLETLRLDSSPWAFKRISHKPIIITDTDTDGGEKQSYLLPSGTYINVPHDAHHKDPRYFQSPDSFLPERFLVRSSSNDSSSSSSVVVGVQQGTLTPYGGGETMCKGRVFAEKECLALVAAIVSIWEIEPVGEEEGEDGSGTVGKVKEKTKAQWSIPEHKKATAVAWPKRDVRVRIRRREEEAVGR
ncbi:MAG: hypothetical protein M1816_005197 [Peltula sp. TS41687]|nr:MAG: hypothetical protein M1816_005197 [Peltula sp. TS41687]